MDRTSVDWTGPMPALTTPFRDDFTIDEEAFASNVDRLFEAGATGMVVAGCTGEFWALTLAERARLARTAVSAGRGRGPVIVGTGAIREGEVVDQIHAAKEAGADGALVLPPYFVHLSDHELSRHFETVDAQSVLPLVLYNIPGNAGNAIGPALADRLADLDRVVAIKESGGDWTSFHDTLLPVRVRIRTVACRARGAGATGRAPPTRSVGGATGSGSSAGRPRYSGWPPLSRGQTDSSTASRTSGPRGASTSGTPPGRGGCARPGRCNGPGSP